MRILFLCICLLFPLTTQATPYTENPDAGETLATSQLLPGGTTSVAGFVGSADADLFAFEWSGGQFNVNTFGSGFDTILSLFNDAGFGVWLNDDTGGAQSSLSLALATGTYYLGVSGFPYVPVSTSGLIWINGLVPDGEAPNGVGASGALSGWNNAAAAQGNYILSFGSPTGAVPLPGTLALFIVACAAVVGVRANTPQKMSAA